MRQPKSAIRHARRSFGIRRSHGQPARRGKAIAAAGRHEGRARAPATRGQTLAATPDPITLGAATWLACGIVLLGLTPLPLRDATLGWSLAFWLLAAPLVVLLARYIWAQKYRSLQTIRPKRLL